MKLNQNHLANPFQLAEAIMNKRFEDYQKGQLFPRKPIYGGDSPSSVAKYTPFEE
jgi:hypothetical protein